jgi:hypothetical protein
MRGCDQKNKIYGQAAGLGFMATPKNHSILHAQTTFGIPVSRYGAMHANYQALPHRTNE